MKELHLSLVNSRRGNNMKSFTAAALLLLVPFVISEQCEPGSRWKEDCNTCFCTPSGVAACTRRGCHSTRMGLPYNECVPKTTWKEDCNTCFCTLKGWAACTRMACPKNVSKRASSIRDCIPGTFWKAECNNCVCTQSGSAICTQRACPSQIEGALVRGWK